MITALAWAAAALLAAWPLARWLDGRSYRVPEDHPRAQVPASRWVPAVAALAAGLLGWRFATAPLVVPLSLTVAVVWMSGLAAVDLDVRRLPDRWTLPGAAAAVLLLAGCSWAVGDAGRWVEAMLCGLGTAAVYLVLALLQPRGLGMGDVKLSLTLGMLLGWFGWVFAVVGFLLAFAVGTLVGIVLALVAGTGRGTTFPFGPAMLLAAVLTLLLPGAAV